MVYLIVALLWVVASIAVAILWAYFKGPFRDI
jgi:hypothetical protein